MYMYGLPPTGSEKSQGGKPCPCKMMPGGKMVPSGKMMPGGLMPGAMMPGAMMPGAMMPGGIMLPEEAMPRPDRRPMEGVETPSDVTPGEIMLPEEAMPRPDRRPMEGVETPVGAQQPAALPEPAPEPQSGEMSESTVAQTSPTGLQGADLQGLVSRVETYMKDEATAERFYRDLAAQIQDETISGHLAQAADNAQNHHRLLGQLHQRLTGRTFEAAPGTANISSFTDGLFQAINGKLEAYEQYRNEYQRFADPQIRHLFFELLSDEIEHAVHFNTAIHLLHGGEM